MTAPESAIALLVAAAVVAVAARHLRVPQTLALLLLGLTVGATHVIPAFALSADLILLVFLPPLLFEAAFVLDLSQLWHGRWEILVLAGPGVVIATLVGGAVIQGGLGLGWSVALLFGVMVAATDPVSVLALFRRLGVEDRLSMIVEGESLLNDGVALVLFATVLEVVRGAGSSVGMVTDFALAVGVGGLVGLATASVGRMLISVTEDHLTEMIVSLAVAYGAFLAADLLHGSGVLATLTAAVMLGQLWRGNSAAFSDRSRRLLADLWSFLAFLANAALFVLIGLEVRVVGLTTHPKAVLIGIVAALLGRAVVAYGLGGCLNLAGRRLSRPERHLLFWGGLRGAVALAAVLSLPADLPARDELVAMTYGAVLFTTLVQGLSLAWLVERLHLGVHLPG